MQLYNARIRLQGSLLNEVPRYDMSAAELLILENIHGSGSVVGVELSKATLSHEQVAGLRTELAFTYDTPVGDPPVPVGMRILSENGFGSMLPETVAAVPALQRLAEDIANAESTQAAIEAAADERAEARRKAAADTLGNAQEVLAVTTAGPNLKPSQEAEIARLKALSSGGESDATADFG